MEIEEESFIKKMSASEELVKARIILNKDQLTNIQIPMGDKYKKEFFLTGELKKKLYGYLTLLENTNLLRLPLQFRTVKLIVPMFSYIENSMDMKLNTLLF